MSSEAVGTVLHGEEDAIRASAKRWAQQPVDLDLTDQHEPDQDVGMTTLAKPVSVTGPGTFLGKAQRTLTFAPTSERGWWFDRLAGPSSSTSLEYAYLALFGVGITLRTMGVPLAAALIEPGAWRWTAILRRRAAEIAMKG